MNDRDFKQEDCGATAPEILPANRLAVRCYESAYWQFQSAGMGDAVFPGQYVQTMLEDLGVTGPMRVDALERIRVLDEQRRSLDRDPRDGGSYRAKREKMKAAE